MALEQALGLKSGFKGYHRVWKVKKEVKIGSEEM